MTALSVFNAILSARLSRLEKVWPPPNQGFAITFAAATRTLGDAPLAVDQMEAAPLLAWGVEWPALVDWSIDDAARVTILLEAADRLLLRDTVALFQELFREGDSREQAAILRSLPFLPQPAAFLQIASDGCRTGVQRVFEAIACENPYPAAHYPELEFNALVLKALFIGLPLRRIVGLGRRLTPELSKMASAFVRERHACGRTVTEDLSQLLPQAADAC